MRKALLLVSPLAGMALLEFLLLGWAAHASGETMRDLATPFSALIAGLLLLTGILPAVLRPSGVHTLVACFALVFAALMVVPFEFHGLPAFRPGIPTYQVLSADVLLRLLNGSILMGMAVHVSARFPWPNPRITARMILMGYIASLGWLAIFLASSLPWIRIPAALLVLAWFVFVMGFFFWSLLAAARDTSPDAARSAQQARIVFFSIALAETPLLLRPFTMAFGLNLIPYNLVLATQLFVPVGISYAVLRHDLFGIDRFLRRTLAYGSVSLALLMLYLWLTTTLTELFVSASRPLAPLISLLVAALLFEPSRRFMQSWLDRLLYPDRLNFRAAVQATQEALARANRREEIIRLLNKDFPAHIGAEWAALKLFPEPDAPPAHLTPGWNARLVAGSVPLGGYWLGPRRAGPAYDTDESNRLHALTNQAALALAYANAYESLFALNQTLEARVREQTGQALADQQAIAAYQERQRLARDLHDSVTQSLFGLHLMARGLKASVPEPLKPQLAELEDLAGGVLREMRVLLDQLRNAAGEETLDLTEAIQLQCDELAHRTGPEGGPLLTVRVDAPPSLILPSALADEALWIIREALQNILKHSGSRTARLIVTRDTALHVTIADDGTGFDESATPSGHYGLRGMRERALALGGEFQVQSAPGRGTTLTFRLPLPTSFARTT